MLIPRFLSYRIVGGSLDVSIGYSLVEAVEGRCTVHLVGKGCLLPLEVALDLLVLLDDAHLALLLLPFESIEVALTVFLLEHLTFESSVALLLI